jgi:UDP-N-acetylmuramyl tripeptide synthase
MEFLDARRLTGPNLLGQEPGAVVDVRCSPHEADRLIDCWARNLPVILAAVGWDLPSSRHHRFVGGVSLYFPAPIDALYAASSISEWAWALCSAELCSTKVPAFDSTLAQTQEAIIEEANPSLLALQLAAALHGTAFLWDDHKASLGHGSRSQVWPVRELPIPEALAWNAYQDIPVALVTGTNGKTTTVRLAAYILSEARNNVGLSSTEWISVNDEIIDRGDWSGPGGARAVLRHPGVDVAILETARGGLLRRGLGVTRADVALITNIAEDHLGDFGSETLDELLDIKWIISRAVEKSGTLILNADDPLLVARARRFSGRVEWTSMQEDNATIRRQVAGGGRAFVLEGDELVEIAKGRRDIICRAGEIPITLGGAARHNVANALAAAALARHLGASLTQIRHGLTSMSPQRNPGRSNLYELRGFRVLVDFAHNPHAMQALFNMARALPARRRVLCFGQAGDRTDAQIRQLARSAWAIGLDRIIISELAAYARGRTAGQVHAILRDELRQCGARDRQILHFQTEEESFDAALQWARPGDLVILLALGGNAPVLAKLAALAE